MQPITDGFALRLAQRQGQGQESQRPLLTRAASSGREAGSPQAPQKQKPPGGEPGGLHTEDCLTMSYFHGRMPTIIGAEAFHGPVRDGKEWFHLAIVVRHNCSAAVQLRQMRHEPPIRHQSTRLAATTDPSGSSRLVIT